MLLIRIILNVDAFFFFFFFFLAGGGGGGTFSLFYFLTNLIKIPFYLKLNQSKPNFFLLTKIFFFKVGWHTSIAVSPIPFCILISAPFSTSIIAISVSLKMHAK